jgi:hypothetical protein
LRLRLPRDDEEDGAEILMASKEREINKRVGKKASLSPP